MHITHLEVYAKDLKAQKEYYSKVLELPVKWMGEDLHVTVGETKLIFTQAGSDFEGAYHFAFNIPENKFEDSKKWISSRQSLLKNADGSDEFDFGNWNSHSLYFEDAMGNILEFIARHDLKNAVESPFESGQILNVSEIGLPSEDVMGLAEMLCSRMGLSVFKQEPNETFTPLGDDEGLLILPRKGRIWFPDTGVPARLLPVRVRMDVNGKHWNVSGMPYQVVPS